VVAGQFSDLNQSTEFLAQDHKRRRETQKEGKMKNQGNGNRREKEGMIQCRLGNIKNHTRRVDQGPDDKEE